MSIFSKLALIVLALASSFTFADSSKPKKVLIVVTSHSKLGTSGKTTGYYLSEVAHPYRVFKEAGFSIEFTSVAGGTPPMDERSRDLKDELNAAFVADENGLKKLNQSQPLKDIHRKQYDAIFFSGGHGTMWDFVGNPTLNNLIKNTYERNSVIAAVCHGPAALRDVKLSNGKFLVAGQKVTGFTNDEEAAVELTQVMPFSLEDELKKRGAVFTKAGKWQSHVEVSDRLVTGQNPASASEVARAVVKLLSDR